MLRTSDLDYDLPAGLIADEPICAAGGQGGVSRDAARLMVVPRLGAPNPAGLCEARAIEHRQVRDLPRLLRPGDLLVLNTSRVIPARLVGFKMGSSDANATRKGWGGKTPGKEASGGRVEGLYLADEPAAGGEDHALWRVLLKGPRLRPGTIVRLLSPDANSSLDIELIRHAENPSESGPSPWIVRVRPRPGSGVATALPNTWLTAIGHTPLPPYILKRRAMHLASDASRPVPDALDREWYQTVVANEAGSIAAPTAGLHFTPSLLEALDAAGVQTAHVQLHVGLGTFRPVQAVHVEDHPMHAESCRVPAEAARAIQASRDRGGRVIAVGTTSARTLEAWAARSFPHDTPVPNASAAPYHWFDTRLLITPGYSWRVVDGLLTNFHLPRTTLMAMVAARLDPSGSGASLPAPGVSRLLDAYRLAVACRYRFFSYGDAMLVLP